MITKTGLIDVKHKKIVQKIFSKYIPDNKEIELDCEDLKAEN